jgi:hypothetical protein
MSTKNVKKTSKQKSILVRRSVSLAAILIFSVFSTVSMTEAFAQEEFADAMKEKLEEGTEKIEFADPNADDKYEVPITGCESYTGADYADCIDQQFPRFKDPCGDDHSSQAYIDCLLGKPYKPPIRYGITPTPKCDPTDCACAYAGDYNWDNYVPPQLPPGFTPATTFGEEGYSCKDKPDQFLCLPAHEKLFIFLGGIGLSVGECLGLKHGHAPTPHIGGHGEHEG